MIIVVLSLMTTLMFLGLFFFSWSNQERSSAEFFAASVSPNEFEIEPILDQAAEQLIVGTRTGFENSALWGGMHSMLAHQIGHINPNLTATDTSVNNGNGIVTRFVDSDNDGYPDLTPATGTFANPADYQFVYNDVLTPASQSLSIDDFIINYGRLAQDDRNHDAFGQTPPLPRYRPDVDYTYPDINCMFLAHQESAWADPANTTSGRRTVLIPSFFRPQLFPAMRSIVDDPQSFQNLYTSATYKKQVFRPHNEHRYDGGDRRYLPIGAEVMAASGDRSRLIGGFPFPGSAAQARMGVFSNPSSEADSNNYSLLDVDLDRDGIKDSIWIDLDMPMLTFSNGRQVIPLASFKVLDADGLLNLNAHGNIQGVTKLSRSPDGNDPFSVSNLGMSRSEVNPLWAFTGDANDLTPAERRFALLAAGDRFSFDAFTVSPVPDQLTLGNMEFGMLLAGWHSAITGGTVPGRYGDSPLLTSGGLPSPGEPGVDDDGDNATVGGFGQPATSAEVGNRIVPPFVHPLPPSGMGIGSYVNPTIDSYLTAGATGARRDLGQPMTNNPAVWPSYRNWQTINTGNPADHRYYPLALQNTLPALADALVDEDDETVLEPGNLLYRRFDAPYEPFESAAMQLSDADLFNSSLNSRLLTLAAGNLKYVRNASDIRKQFTTESWDRLEFSYSAPTFRSWEWGTDTSIPPRFPPSFTLAQSDDVQPFRAEIRRLFYTEYESQYPIGSRRISPRHRLNLNRILSDDQLGGGGQPAFIGGSGADPVGSPRFRHLVPHPAELVGGNAGYGSTPMFHGDGAPPVPFSAIATDPIAQEWWARYDRQRLARDIYTLLWVLGAGQDAMPNPGPPADDVAAQRAREIAQFAVNVVDAMDRDRIVTRFEYDPNPSDGWNADPANLSVVYGVEHQELAFNEVLFIRTAEQSTDSTLTDFDDSDGDHFHSFVELRNAAPWPVKIDDLSWRLRRVTTANPAAPTLFSVVLRDSVWQDLPADPQGEIKAGGEYLIGCQDGKNRFGSGGTVRPSDFRLDFPNSSTFKLIVPNIIEPDTEVPSSGTSEADWPEPRCDLDLVHPDHLTRVEAQPAIPGGTLLNELNYLPGENVRLVLERRLRPDPNGLLSDVANPWIEVDRIESRVREFNPGQPVDQQLQDQLVSRERRSPYDSGLTYSELEPSEYNGSAVGANGEGRHTMPYHTRAAAGAGERRNSLAPEQYEEWQPHFDRDFSSVMELLSVPLYGYCEADMTRAWVAPIDGGTTKNVCQPGANLQMSGHRTAAMKMLFPQAEDDTEHPLPSWFQSEAVIGVLPGAGAGLLKHDANRWYRLLEFVDVKSQNTLRMDDIQAIQRRTPGKVNLNTIRHEAVLAGLIDDPYHIDPRNKALLQTQDQLDGNRYWYLEHRRLRDGVDPLMDNAGIPFVSIPGGLRSRPFRSLGYLEQPLLESGGNPDVASAPLSVQQTILRQRDPLAGHGLYEARSLGDVGLDEVDYHTRHRILGKIANNSTTKSHVFFAWIGIDFFEAHVNANQHVQIGARADDLPQRRMFVVIDMSQLEEAYDPATQTFDFRKFIIHRQLLP